MSNTNNNNLGGTSVMTTLKPEFDMLLTYRRDLKDGDTFGYAKAGGMYRHMTFDRGTINDLQKINFEIQVGVSHKIAENLSISFGYQGVFSNGLGLRTSAVTMTGEVKNIPSQHGALLSLNYYV
jgi:hypothetical protein